MTQDEIIRFAIQCNLVTTGNRDGLYMDALTEFANLVAAKVLAQPKQEPVAWLITDEKINSLQVDSIQRLIDRARHAHMIDIKLRINGQDEWYQADWLKHLIRATPPQRTWVGLTDEEVDECYYWKDRQWTTDELVRHVEAKLKERNT